MNLSKNLLDKLVDVTTASAVSCYPYLGKKDKIITDKAATDSMRTKLNKLDINGKVVIGGTSFSNLKQNRPFSSLIQ